MKYIEPQFTIPVASSKVDQKTWDLAFMKPEEFAKKYFEMRPNSMDIQNGR